MLEHEPRILARIFNKLACSEDQLSFRLVSRRFHSAVPVLSQMIWWFNSGRNSRWMFRHTFHRDMLVHMFSIAQSEADKVALLEFMSKKASDAKFRCVLLEALAHSITRSDYDKQIMVTDICRWILSNQIISHVEFLVIALSLRNGGMLDVNWDAIMQHLDWVPVIRADILVLKHWWMQLFNIKSMPLPVLQCPLEALTVEGRRQFARVFRMLMDHGVNPWMVRQLCINCAEKLPQSFYQRSMVEVDEELRSSVWKQLRRDSAHDKDHPQHRNQLQPRQLT